LDGFPAHFLFGFLFPGCSLSGRHSSSSCTRTTDGDFLTDEDGIGRCDSVLSRQAQVIFAITKGDGIEGIAATDHMIFAGRSDGADGRINPAVLAPGNRQNRAEAQQCKFSFQDHCKSWLPFAA